MMSVESIILASKSKIRAALLENSGVQFSIKPPQIDEAAVKAAILAEDADLTAEDLAGILAQTKAASVSEHHGGFAVVGADQVLVLDGRIIDKPQSKDDARDQLVELRGKTHQLHSAVAVARHGRVIWHHTARADLTMRKFSNEFLGFYLAATGGDITTSVGGYKLEGPGAQLFEKVDGDYFTVLGLPLLPLLEFLRSDGILNV